MTKFLVLLGIVNSSIIGYPTNLLKCFIQYSGNLRLLREIYFVLDPELEVDLVEVSSSTIKLNLYLAEIRSQAMKWIFVIIVIIENLLSISFK